MAATSPDRPGPPGAEGSQGLPSASPGVEGVPEAFPRVSQSDTASWSTRSYVLIPVEERSKGWRALALHKHGATSPTSTV